MKKLFVLIYCWVVVLSCFADEYLQSIFSDVVPKNLPNYEFVIRNPLFIDDYYITDLSKLKSKILMKQSQSYKLDKNGKRCWPGESTDLTKTDYVCFDKSGKITVIYTVKNWYQGPYSPSDSSTSIIQLQERKFEYGKDAIYENIKQTERYISGSIDKKTHSYNDKTYSIMKTQNGIEIAFSKPSSELKTMFFYKKNNLLEIKQIGSDKSSFIIKTYKGDACEKKEFSGNSLSYVTNYRCAEFLKATQLTQDGSVIKKREYTKFSGDGKYVSSYFGNSKNPDISEEFASRCFSPVGFLEYQEQRPLQNGTAGDYIFYDAKIIDDFDEEFKEHFNDEFYGQF